MREAFGDSSGSEEEEEAITEDEARGGSGDRSKRLVPIWEAVVEIRGLWLCTDFLSPQQQSRLLSALRRGTYLLLPILTAEGWLGEGSNNQAVTDKSQLQKAMRFGNLPWWATELCNSVRDAVVLAEEAAGARLLPPDILWRQPLFDQLIANVYQPGEGICAHVDLMRFEDGIAIVSLESSCVMHFSNVEHEEGREDAEEDEERGKVGKVPVYLPPGSLVLLSGDARYSWKHEINRRPGFQFWEGKELNQKQRTSITLRKLCPVD
ncbi:unnamed protein product [Linum tenue]|uniref:Fe2OG dioxygenase domain-containing protein n=2 Tax=Linum tenue TaxID=586396 RepID=A0AAV0L640_9ROSI|nr:unnamed protein product [Linum tenue]